MVFIAVVTVAVCLIISHVFDFWPGAFTEKQRNELIVEEVILSVMLLCNGFLFVLLGRYTAKLVSASLA
uniref:Uncharacterized protein n=1 Tax=Tetranychus urticae TaxID=32264 RepID=T1L6I2_TETUR